jgi:predicted ATPase/DNA-binding CsgD family transcriptional regulator
VADPTAVDHHVPLAPVPFQTRKPLGAPAPVPLTSFVGREDEIAAVAELVRQPETRLITLVGPGGIGKTRLALRVANEVGGAFPDGVWFVSLAGVAGPARVLDGIADALGVKKTGGRPALELLAASLHDAEALLVLDNFEHLLDAAVVLIDLLSVCPRLTLLVTSQTLLRVSGEHAFPVPPLSMPGLDAAASLDDVIHLPALRLFAERARAIAPSFALTAATAPLVADICNRLDGLPLAIELAAARVNYLPLATLRDRLDRRLPLLTGGARDAPRRHRTMSDAIAWSHDLLTAEEKAVFRRLAVFAGGSTLEMAEIVGGESGAPVLEVVGSLVDKSLLQRTGPSDEEPRFGMLETVRAFALEQLEASGEAEAVRDRHAECCSEFVERLGSIGIHRLEELPWLPPIEAEHDNIRAAFAWRERNGDAAGMLRLALAMQPLWEVRGHHDEAIGWLDRGLAAADNASPDLRMRAQVALGRRLKRHGNYDQAQTRFQSALELARELGDQRATANALYALGGVALNQEQYEAATTLLEESLTIFQELSDSVGMCGAEYSLGIVGYGLGDIAGAVARVESALATRRANGPIFNLSVLLNAVGLLRCEQGDVAGGERALVESREIWRRGLGANREILAEWLAAAARLELARNRAETAARLYGAAEALTEAIRAPLVVPPRGQYLRLMTVLRAQLSADELQTAWAAGRATPPEEAVNDALASPAPQPNPATATSTLTPREADVLRLLALGLPDREIAAALFLSVRTVEGHVAHILAKLDAPSRTAAARVAIAAGLVPPDAPVR